jgi:hypothetical protein
MSCYQSKSRANPRFCELFTFKPELFAPGKRLKTKMRNMQWRNQRGYYVS